jgi:acyl-CoA thioesterase I
MLHFPNDQVYSARKMGKNNGWGQKVKPFPAQILFISVFLTNHGWCFTISGETMMSMKIIGKPIVQAFLAFFLVSTSVTAQDVKTILFFGNSLTAGLGVQPGQSFPGVIQKKLDEEGYEYKVVNAGLSGETSAGGLARVDWILKNNKIDIFVLELGANDGLRGLDLEQTKKNLAGIIDKVRAKDPSIRIILAGMEVPPNLGTDYANRFRQLFKDLASKQKVTLVPFLLDGVGGVASLNQSDGIHPNAEGHKIMAENVWEVLKPLLKK